MTFTRNGLTFTERLALPGSCAGCHFDGPNCTHDMQPSCMAGQRADRNDVIFVVSPALDAHLQEELPL